MAVDPAERALTPEEQQEVIDNWDGTVGMKLEEEKPFLGEIIADEIQPGKFGKPQWHVAVKPLEFELRGKTGAFHEYYGLSSNARSKMGAMLLSIQASRAVDKGTPVGKGQLVGLQAWFAKRDLKFGRGSDGQPIVAEGVIVVHHKATDEELANAGNRPTSAGEAAAPAAPDWTDEQIEAVVAAIDGVAVKDMQKTVLNRQSEASKLPRELKNALLNGTAVTFLSEQGKIAVENGTIARMPF